MLRFFLLWCLFAPVFAALPSVSMAQGKELSSYEGETEELLATFSIVGDSTKTPFILRITFENCNNLRDTYNNTLPLTDLKLKYYKTELQAWETIDLETGKDSRAVKNSRQERNLRLGKNSRVDKNLRQDKNLKSAKTMPSKGMLNCMHNIEFYEDLQEKYDIEIYAFWNKWSTVGTYYGNAYLNILPKP